MLDFQINIQGADAILKTLSVNLDKQMNDLVFDLANKLENTGVENLQRRIYQQPPSPTYVRTGRAQRGRSNEKVQNGRRVKFDPKLAGADRNYAPFLNRNRRITKLNTLFWEDAVEDTKKRMNAFAKAKIGFYK